MQSEDSLLHMNSSMRLSSKNGKPGLNGEPPTSPDQISLDEEPIQKLNDSGKLRWHGHDKANRPCLYYKMKYHKADIATTDETVRYFLYMLEKGLEEADKLGSQKVVVLYDRRGYGKKNHDPKSVDTSKKLMPFLQEYYPERLHVFYVMGANWFYKMMFALIKTFISKKTIEKVCLLGDNEDLLQHFDKEQLHG